MSGALTHPPSKVIRQLFVDLGIGTLPSANGAWPIGVSQEADKPDNVITIYDTSSEMQGRIMIDGVMVERYGFQARIRNSQFQGGYTKASEIQNAMDSVVKYTTVTVVSSEYIVYAVSRKSGILSLGKIEQSDRNLFTVNAVVTIRQTT